VELPPTCSRLAFEHRHRLEAYAPVHQVLLFVEDLADVAVGGGASSTSCRARCSGYTTRRIELASARGCTRARASFRLITRPAPWEQDPKLSAAPRPSTT